MCVYVHTGMNVYIYYIRIIIHYVYVCVYNICMCMCIHIYDMCIYLCMFVCAHGVQIPHMSTAGVKYVNYDCNM